MCRPVLFLKPPSAAVYAAKQNAEVPLELVKGKGDVHYEAEVVLRLNEALQVDAVTLGLDLTLRDLQAKLKKDGHPWEIAKVWSTCCLAPCMVRCIAYSCKGSMVKRSILLGGHCMEHLD